MAWDIERTKQLLLDAATQEFSGYGLAGARVDRIAKTAGVNKERIYQYFGNKEALFAVVLQRALAAVMDSVSLRGSGIEAVVDYAGRVFDYQREHPELARLTFWEGLELGAPVAEEARSRGASSKVAALRDALPALTEVDARELLITILTLVDGWEALPTMDRIYTGRAGRDAARTARRRDVILLTVEAATRATMEASSDHSEAVMR